MEALVADLAKDHPVYAHMLSFALGAGLGGWAWRQFLSKVLPKLIINGLTKMEALGMTIEQEEELDKAIEVADAIIDARVAARKAAQSAAEQPPK